MQRLEPDRVPQNQGGPVVIFGSEFIPGTNIHLRLISVVDEPEPKPGARQVQLVGKCLDEHRIEFCMPPRFPTSCVSITCAMDGQHFVNPETQLRLFLFSLTGLRPSSGPVSGGTKVHLVGLNLSRTTLDHKEDVPRIRFRWTRRSSMIERTVMGSYDEDLGLRVCTPACPEGWERYDAQVDVCFDSEKSCGRYTQDNNTLSSCGLYVYYQAPVLTSAIRHFPPEIHALALTHLSSLEFSISETGRVMNNMKKDDDVLVRFQMHPGQCLIQRATNVRARRLFQVDFPPCVLPIPVFENSGFKNIISDCMNVIMLD